MKQDYFRVGVFTSTHGIKGEINVFPTTDDLSRFDYLKRAFFDTQKGLIPVEVEGVKYFKGMAILKMAGIDRIEDIEGYKGCDILVAREDALPLGEGEHYIADLIGLTVYDEEGKNLGIVKDIMQTGANDVYVIEKNDKKELLIPSIPDCILNIDIDNNKLLVHLLDGLEDL